MILADFTTAQNSRYNDNQKHKQTNVVSNQGVSSRGHRHVDDDINSQKKQSNDDDNNNTHTIETYINQLNIPGVRQAYYNSQKYIQQQKLLHQTMLNEKQQHLHQSIQRLYSTGFAWKKNTKNTQQHAPQQQQNSPQHEDDKRQKLYYNQLYELDGRFDYEFRVKRLQLGCKQLKKELFNKFIAKYLIWVAENQQDKTAKQYKQHSLKQSHPRAKMTVMLISLVQTMFVKSLVTFLLAYTIPSKTSNTFLSPQDQLTISYSDFLNHHKRRQWSNHTLNSSIAYDIQLARRLKSLSDSLPFVYYFLSYNRLQREGGERLRNVSDLEVKVMGWLRKGEYQWENIYKVFERKLQPKFTVPFQTKLYEVKKMANGNQDNKKEQEEYIQMFQPFKANPIPQSTYQKPPSTSLQTKKPPTQPEPFNFTHPSAPPKTANDYYSWDRNFKANPIPKTQYQPQLIGLPQKQKQLLTISHKQRLYHQAKYPQTMNYLQNFNQYQQDKKKQLQQKYTQNRQQDKPKAKEIPDFEKLHKKDMHLLQTRKEMNRANTQPKPFKFTSPKQGYSRNTLKDTLIMSDFQFSQKQRKSNNISHKSPVISAKTTAKFDAYVQLRKQQKQQKQKQKQQRQLHKKRQEQDKRRYKDILKQRMQSELLHQPKAMQYQNNNNATAINMVKVDLEEIYLERPLLMEGSCEKNNSNKKKNNKTCFTDHYESII